MGVRRVKGIVERITATAMSRVKNFFMIKLLTKLNFGEIGKGCGWKVGRGQVKGTGWRGGGLGDRGEQ
jgi:hypothetical protein